MAIVNVDSIVSVSGGTTAISGDITYVAQHGYTTLADAVASGANTIVMDGFNHSAIPTTFSGGTIIGINNSMISDTVDGAALSGVRDVSGMTFSGNSNAAGAAIDVTSYVKVGNSLFTNTRSTNEWGAVAVRGSAGADIVNSIFANNGGAALYSASGNVRVSGSTFSGNSIASGYYGAIYNLTTLTVENSLFNGNAGSQGSAIRHNSTAQVTITGSTFSNNSGGATLQNVASGTIAVSDSLFANNPYYALTPGSGLITVTGSTFSGNSGIVYHTGTGTVEIHDSFATGNGSAGENVYVHGDGTAIITGSTFVNNSGIGVWMRSGGVLRVSGSTFSGFVKNPIYATNINSKSSTIYIDNSVFDHNSAANGAGFWLSNDGGYHSTAYITNTTFSNGSASAYGGAMRLNPGTEVHMANVTVVGNTDAYDSAIMIYNSTVYLEGLLTLGADQRILFDGNGGLVYIDGSSFFNGYGVAKAVETNRDSWGSWTTNLGQVARAPGVHYIFGMDNDVYTTNLEVVVSGDTFQWNPNGLYNYATLEAAQAAGKNSVVLMDYVQTGDISIASNSILAGGSATLGGNIIVTNDAALALSGAVTLSSALTVSGGTAAIDNLNLSVSSDLFTGMGEFFTMIDSVSLTDPASLKINLDGESIALNEWFDMGGSLYQFTVKNGSLGLEAYPTYDPVYAVLNGATSIVLDGQTITFAGRDDVFTSVGEAMGHIAQDGTIVIVGLSVAKYNPGETTTILVDSTISGYSESGNTYAINTTGEDVVNLRMVNGSVTDEIMIHGDAISGDLTLEFDNTNITNNWTQQYFVGVGVGGDFNITLKDITLHRNGVYLLRSTALDSGVVGGTIGATLDNVTIDGSFAVNPGGTGVLGTDVTYNFTNTNIGGAAYIVGGSDSSVSGNVDITLTGSTIGSYLAISGGGNIAGSASVTLVGSTVNVVRKRNNTTATVGSLTLTVSGAENIVGNMNEVDALVFNSGASLELVNTAAIDLSGVTLGGSNSLTFNGSAVVNFTSQDLSGVSISVGTGNLPAEGESFTIATGVAGMAETITVGGQAVTLGEETVIGGNTYTFALNGTDFAVSRAMVLYDTTYAVLNGATEVMIGGTLFDLTGANAFDSVAAAKNHLAANGTLVMVGGGVADDLDNAPLIVVDGSFAAHTYLYSLGYSGNVSVDMERVTMPTSGKNLYICGRTFFEGKVDFSAADSSFAGDVALTAAGGTVARMLCSDVTYDINNTYVAGGIYGGGSDSHPIITGDVNITLTGSTAAKIIGDRANRMEASQNITVTLVGSSVGSVAKFDYGKDHQYVLANMTLNVSGAVNSVIGSLSDVDKLSIGTGSSVTFTTAQDLSATTLFVDGSAYAGVETTVASGVSALGSYTVTGAAPSTFLKVAEGNLVMYTRAADVDSSFSDSSYTGTGTCLMTGGTITGAFVGIRNPAANADVKNVISGGTIGNALIGGALVSSGSTATLDTVTLDIAGNAQVVGGAANGGMVYTAGYAYGADPNTLDSSATLTVAKSVLNLSAGSVPAQNLYSGAHARKGAYTVVGKTEINVTGGSFGRIYGGGWAEKVGKSEVGTSTISVSGGIVDYIYAGGGNAEGGSTVVTGTVTIDVSGNAQVGFAFLAGKNQNCSIDGNVTMTVSGNAKSMTRVSGWNANGRENPSLTTLDLKTSLNVEYLDHVDVVRIAEGKTLNVSADLWYEAASALKIDFDLDGALDTDWTAMSGVGMDIYRSALYTIDGGDVVYTYDETSGKLVNGTTESGYGLDFSEANKVKFVTIA